MFEWATGIPVLDETQEEAPDMIYEYELYVEDVVINNDDNGQEEDWYEHNLNIIEENKDPVNEEGIYIMEEEKNNKVDNTNIKNNEDDNVMNTK